MITDSNKYNLPNTWVLTTIGEIGIVTSGGTPPTRQIEFWGGDISWITPADLSGYKDKYIEKGRRNITQIGLENSSAKLLPKGSVLFSSRAPIGYAVIAKNDITTNQGFKNIIVTKSGYSDYLYYYLLSSKQLAESYASGTTFKELSAKKFKEIPIPLPPLKEQYRIVEKIEELFSELDKSKESLLESQKQLELYRQVVLKDAYDYENATYVHLKEIISNVQYGYTAKSDFNIKGTKYLRITDIQDDSVIWDNVPSCEINNEDYEKYKLFEDDILFARAGTVGKTVLIKANPPKSVFASYLIKINIIKEKVKPKYLIYYFKSYHYENQIIETSTGVAQPNLNGTKLKELLIPYIPLNEQEHKIKEIEYRFTLIDNLEKSIKENLQRIEVFRQTIYKKAFSGNLVSQNANDEPASKLLERIKEEKQIYEKMQKEIAKKRVKKIKPMESNKSVKEILEQAKEPMEAKVVWQNSKHKNDIERFYEELKNISKDIQEIRDGKISKLTLKK